MKIAYSPTIFKVQREGGISRYFYQLITGMLSLGNEVYLSGEAPEGKYIDLLKNTSASFSPEKGNLLTSAMTDERNPLGWAPRSLRNWDPDIIHETYFSSKWFKAGPKRARRVLTVYDLIEEKLASSPDYRSRKKEALKRADHVICISETTRKDLVEIHNFPIEKTSVIYLAPFPLPNPSFSPLPMELTNKEKYFLYVGARDGYKNFKILVEAFAIFNANNPGYSVVAFGGGSFTDAEIALFKEHGLREKFSHLSGSDLLLSHSYKNAVAFIYPSIWEGFGMPPLEALALGTPVIASSSDCLHEILSSDSVMFFDPMSSSELNLRMNDALSRDSNRLELTSAWEKLLKQFSWEQCVKQTFESYRNLF